VSGASAGNPLPLGSISWTITSPGASTLLCSPVTPTVNTVGLALPTTAYSCSFPTATAGNYTVLAAFPGDANYNSITSSPRTIAVTPTTPILSVTGIQSSTVGGQIITYTGTITGTTGSLAPTGAPTWSLGGPSGVIGSCQSTGGPVTNGVASIYTCVVPASVAGTYTAAIAYASDSNYTTAGPSATFSLSLTKITPTVVVTTSASTIALGSNFTFTATVSGVTGGATPSGAGSWSITGVSGITCSTNTGPLSSGIITTYTCNVIASSAGTYVPVFTYGGDTNFLATAPTSGYTTTVAKATPTVVV
jgi:hypothetical protein